RRVRALVADHWDRQVWLPHDAAARALDGRPALPRIRGRQVRAQDRRWAPFLTDVELAALELLEWDVELWIHHTNERIVANELSRRRDFFDSVEKSPLTEEQARAVVTFDNRVRVIAA